MSWSHSRDSNSEEKLREYIVEKIAIGEAFWALPEKNEFIWSYEEPDNSQKVILRNINQPQAEIIFSNDNRLDTNALQSLLLTPELAKLNTKKSFWSAKIAPSKYTSATAILGIYEPNARERLEYKKKDCLLNGVLIKSDSKITAKAHAGFPEPMQGFEINL